MINLPHEIWLQIVEYLPDHQVRALYSVNRNLYNISLDLRYKNVSIGILPDRVIENSKGLILWDKCLSSRPTILEIKFYDRSIRLGPNVMQMDLPLGPNVRQTSLLSLKNFVSSVMNPTLGLKPEFEPVTPTVKLARILHAMPKLSRVTKLSFTASEWDLDNEAVSLIFPEVIGFIGDRLQALHIQSHFVAYLPPRIECLKSFSLDAHAPYHTTKLHHIMVEKIPTFVQAHASTLRDVSFSVDTLTWSIAPILQCFRLISCLCSLRLSLPYYEHGVTTTAVHLRRILETHQHHLRTLTLGSVPYWDKSDDRLALRSARNLTSYLNQTWDSLDLPNLQQLTLCLPGTRSDADYIRPFTRSLTSLKLTRLPFTPFLDDLRLEHFCETVLGEFPSLRELSLFISILEVDHLIIFARTLPNLHSLHLDCRSHTPGFGWALMNIDANSAALFSNWALESLEYNGGDDWLDRKMLIHLPNVVWINKKTREKCLSTACK